MDNENFKKLHGFFIEDLKKGQNAEITRKITEKDINDFALLTSCSDELFSSVGLKPLQLQIALKR